MIEAWSIYRTLQAFYYTHYDLITNYQLTIDPLVLTHPVVLHQPTLISTWLKVLPLWIPTTLPIISGTTIMFRRCVFTTAGFSMAGASFLALRSRLIRASGLRFRPAVQQYRR